MRIFNRYFSTYDLILVAGDSAIAFSATLVVRILIHYFEAGASPAWMYWTLQSAAVTLALLISFYYSDLYAIDQTLTRRVLLLRLMGGIGLACLTIGSVSYSIPQFGTPLNVSEMLAMTLAICAWRLRYMRVIERARIHGRVLIVGVQTIGRLVAQEILHQKKLGMEVVGFVGNSADPLTLSYGSPVAVSAPVFQSNSIASLFNTQRVNRILIAGADGCSEHLGRELVRLRTLGIAIEDCHSFYERLVSKIAITDLSPEWLVRSQGFRRDRFVIVTKRMIDVVVAVLGFIVTSPLLLLTALAIKLESPGSVLYKQERVGEDGKIFTILKFRSMSNTAEATIGPVWASKNDPRVTRIGKFIRKVRIDEIPQMINVLNGEMSLVGPRPERPYFVDIFSEKIPYYPLRHSVKPGITGWAQICYPYGDSEQDALEKLQYDLYYIKNLSPLFDLQILFESLKVVLLGTGAR